MSQLLSGQVALVTGASKGIGAAIAQHLARAGAAVVVNYASSREAAERVVQGIADEGGRAIAVQADISRADEIERLVAAGIKAFGRLDILVNNAGIYEFAALEDISEEHFHRQFNLNVLGLLLTTRAAVAQFGPAGGSVINISSVVSRLTPPNSAVYAATKAAVDAITSSLAKELAGRKIRVNSVNPGLIETEGVIDAGLNSGDMRAWVESTAPAKRIGRVEDIAPAVVFLASRQADYITGEMLTIAGGLK